MVRILYWNIQIFSRNKIANPAAPQASNRRLIQILSNLAVNTPDIFVVVEVSTGGGPIGSPITALGAVGSMQLLAEIRANIPGNWFLVPPLISGTGGFAEGIAVYYNAATVTFTGPNVLRALPGGGVISVTPPVLAAAVAAGAAAGAAAYAAPWVGFAPLGAVGGGPINALPAGNNLAGKVRFHAVAPPTAAPGVTGRPLTFPNLNNRSPFLTTFTEVGGPHAGRLIKVIAFHSSPPLAVVGTAFMLGMEELVTPPTGNEVQVMVADFNVPLGAALAPAAYAPFGQIGFTQQITLPAPPAPVRTATQMLPWAGSSPVGVYPHYGYMNPANSLDNIFTRYSTAVATVVPAPAGGPIAGANAAVAAIPPIPAVVMAALGGAAITVTVAVAAALEAAAVAPNAAANVLNALAAIPALAGLMVPPLTIQAAVNAAQAVGGMVPAPVVAALAAGGAIAFPLAVAAANAAAIALAGDEVFALTQQISIALVAAPAALGATIVAAATPAALAAGVAAAVANAAHVAALATTIPTGPGVNSTAAAAQLLARAAASTGIAGLAAAVPVAGLVAGFGNAAAAGAAPPLPANIMIVNRVTGARYGAAGPVAVPVYPSTLLTPALLGMGGVGNLMAFRGWNNYRAIRSTSDHIALVIEV